MFAKEKVPSMAIFVGENGRYRFKDFSTGKAGDSIALVGFLHEQRTGVVLPFRDICDQIVENFIEFQSKEGTYLSVDIDPQKPYKVRDYKVRKWNTIDANFWSSYWLGSDILEKYKVAPLSGYEMVRENDEEDRFTIEDNYIYGYFSQDGLLYKIYQPMSDRKFLKISDYIQGIEQLKYDQDILIIASSLKDGMVITKFDMDLEFIAPHSENSTLRASAVSKFRMDYKYIFTLFDNDEAGRKARETYVTTYNIPPLIVNVEKDISDAVKKYTPAKIKPIFQRELNKLLLSCVKNSTLV